MTRPSTPQEKLSRMTSSTEFKAHLLFDLPEAVLMRKLESWKDSPVFKKFLEARRLSQAKAQLKEEQSVSTIEKVVDQVILWKRTISTSLSIVGGLFIILGMFLAIKWRIVVLINACILVLAVSIANLSDTDFLRLPEPRGSPSATKLMVFIHGWMGDTDTFSNFPAQVLADERFKDIVAVLPLSYPTYLQRRNLSRTPLAKLINKHLQEKSDKYDSLFILAHSMGGLISRDIIIQDVVSHDKSKASILIEVASPHLGGNYAGIAAALGISPGLMEDLRSSSTNLESLNTYWELLEKRKKPLTSCYFSPSDDFVTKESAIYGCDCSKEYPTGSHTEIVKPPNTDDIRYKWPMSEIVKGLNPAFEPSMTPCGDGSIRKK